uniref:Cation channel complex component UNC80 N-terminal domain-containing protein n=1 Tax=Panagrolaimus sp. PS1159 TaxID=55785 RepID=A0AC35GF07_9BILA
MPLSTAAGSVKSSRWSEKAEDDDNIECEPVPLPIQTFLWRQTNPFLGAKSYKLHEASSVTFERVVVQNILHGLSPKEIESHIRLESGLRLWQAFWQYRTPDILCFCAPVKQRRCQLPQVTMAKKLPATTAVEQGIYLGDENIANRRLSQVPQISVTIPPPKPPRTDLNVLREIQQKQRSPKKEDLPPPVPTVPLP